MSKPECYGNWVDSLKCAECAVSFLCLKERERELKYRERQRVNAEAVIEGIKTYHQRNKRPEIRFTLKPVRR